MLTTQQSTASVNQRDIRRALELFLPKGGIAEVRALGCYDCKPEYKRTRNGYFDSDHIDECVHAVYSMVNAWHASGVYITLNPVTPPLLARSANKARTTPKGESTKDSEIADIRWILIDCDPVRPAGISSSDEELELAEEKVKEIGRYLEAEGFARPAIAMSGNGWHLLYAVRLSVEDSALVAQLLKALDRRFSDEAVKVDTSVFNPSRITKLYGTPARKGDSTPDRPHRISDLVDAPDRPAITPREKIEAVARQFFPPSSHQEIVRPAGSVTTMAGDSKAMSRALAYIARVPGAVEGKKGSVATFVLAKKLFGFGLSCEQVMELMLEWNQTCLPPWSDSELQHKIDDAFKAGPYLMKDRSGPGPSVPPTDQQVGWHGPLIMHKSVDRGQDGQPGQGGGGTAGERFKAAMIPAGDLVRKFPEMREVLIEDVLRRSEIMNIIASPKAGKSWLVLGLALAVASGGKWLGRFLTKPGRVLLIDNELHSETLASRLRAVAEESGLSPEQWEDRITVVCLRGQTMDLRDVAIELASSAVAGKFDLCIMDAFYRFLPAEIDENSNADICSLYNLLCTSVEAANLSVVLIHHASKGDQSAKGVTDVGSGAGSQSRAADAHFVIRPHEEESVFVVDVAVRSFPPVDPFCIRKDRSVWLIDESLDPKKLRTNRLKRKQPDQTNPRPTREEVRQQFETETRRKIIATLLQFPQGETKSRIRDTSLVQSTPFNRMLAILQNEKVIEECDIQKSKRVFPGFRLTEIGKRRYSGESGDLGRNTLSPDSPDNGFAGTPGSREGAPL